MRTSNPLLLGAACLANAVQASAANARQLSLDISVPPFAVFNSSTVTITPPSSITPTPSPSTLTSDIQTLPSSSATSSLPYSSSLSSSELSTGPSSSTLDDSTIINTDTTSTLSTWLSTTTSFPSTSAKNTTSSSHFTRSSTPANSSSALNSSSIPPQTTLRTTTIPQSDTSSHSSHKTTRHRTKTRCHGTTCSHHGPHTITNTVEVQRPNATEKCTLLGEGETATIYEIKYTSTVTFKGNRTDYRPPHPTITTPHYCGGTAIPAFPHGGFSSMSEVATASGSVIVVYSSDGQQRTTTVAYSRIGSTRILQKPIATYTFTTTDKNPSVYYPSEHVPDYTQTWNVPGGDNPTDHKTVHPGGGGKGPDGVDGPLPTYTITAGRGSVVINKSTFTGLNDFQTTTVTVGQATFTINPTGIVGEGASISRPGQTPVVTRAVGGVPVTMAGSNAIIGGQTLTLPPVQTVTNINGHTITLGPAGVTINGHTFTPEIPQPTQWNVQGGELLTAIGQSVVVVHSTTITYGPGKPEMVTVINGDPVSIEPTGVVVHGLTLGGPDAEATDRKTEIVGGATIGKIPPSMVVINGVTYSIGPGAGLRTVVAGNELITLGPLGVIMASVTMSFPLDATMVTTFAGTRNPSADQPAETGGNNDDEDSGSLALRPDMRMGVMFLCIAIGVLVIG